MTDVNLQSKEYIAQIGAGAPYLAFKDTGRMENGRSVLAPIVALDDNSGDFNVEQVLKDAASDSELLATYGNFSSIAAGDFVTRKAYSNGQIATILSASPLTEDSLSSIDVTVYAKQPCALEIEASMSQRIRHDFAVISLFANDLPDGDGRAAPVDMTIASIYQSSADNGAAYNAVAGTIVTVNLDNPLPASVYLSDWVHIYGLVDNRLNYPNAAIKFISTDRKTFTFGFSDETALPSLAVAAITPSLANGTPMVKFYENMGGAIDGAAYRFTGTNATQAALASIFGGGDVQISGTLLGDHRVTVGSSNPQYVVGVNGQSEIKANSRYKIEARPRDVSFLDSGIDQSSSYTPRAIRTAVKPDSEALLRPRFRLVGPKSMSRPIGKIASITKSASTTCTVNMPNHGLKVGNWVTINGVRDQTNFANSATPAQVASVINAHNFTIAWGISATATSYGGAVSLCNGGVAQQGLLAQVVNSAAYDATTGKLTLVGSAAWSTGIGVMNIGDYMEVYGVRDASNGADLGVDGAWEVSLINGTALELMPVYNIQAQRVSPDRTTLTTTNCGGIVLHRTTLRAHDIIYEKWNEARVMLDGQGTTRLDKAMPVRLLTDDTTGTNRNVQGAAARAATVSGNPIVAGMRGSSAQPTAVSNGQVVDPVATLIGAIVNKPYAIPELVWNASNISLTTTTPVALAAAAGAGLKRYISAIQMKNTGAAAVDVIILDGATVRWQQTLNAGETMNFDFPVELLVTANTALNINLSAAGTVKVNAQGYTAP